MSFVEREQFIQVCPYTRIAFGILTHPPRSMRPPLSPPVGGGIVSSERHNKLSPSCRSATTNYPLLQERHNKLSPSCRRGEGRSRRKGMGEVILQRTFSGQLLCYFIAKKIMYCLQICLHQQEIAYKLRFLWCYASGLRRQP